MFTAILHKFNCLKGYEVNLLLQQASRGGSFRLTLGESGESSMKSVKSLLQNAPKGDEREMKPMANSLTLRAIQQSWRSHVEDPPKVHMYIRHASKGRFDP